MTDGRRRAYFFLRTQAAVVAATTLAMSSPAFAATIKLGGDNGELGFFVRAVLARAHAHASPRSRSQPVEICSHFLNREPSTFDPTRVWVDSVHVRLFA